MKAATAVVLSLAVVGVVSCRKRPEVTASETRQVTMRDEHLKLDATNAERFGAGPGMPSGGPAPQGSPLVAGSVPEGWSEAPGNSMRLLNYRFGEAGEVYLSLSRGGVLDNVNRWRRQFGQEPLDAAGLDALEAISLPGYEGVWIEAEGTYGAGMGQGAKEGYGLAGVVAAKGEDILTVKMVGPNEEVRGAVPALRQFVSELRPAE